MTGPNLNSSARPEPATGVPVPVVTWALEWVTGEACAATPLDRLPN